MHLQACIGLAGSSPAWRNERPRWGRRGQTGSRRCNQCEALRPDAVCFRCIFVSGRCPTSPPCLDGLHVLLGVRWHRHGLCISLQVAAVRTCQEGEVLQLADGEERGRAGETRTSVAKGHQFSVPLRSCLRASVLCRPAQAQGPSLLTLSELWRGTSEGSRPLRFGAELELGLSQIGKSLDVQSAPSGQRERVTWRKSQKIGRQSSCL